MKTSTTYNYKEIINNIKSGSIDQICVILIERWQDDGTEDFADWERFIDWEEGYFAGTTADDARRCMNWIEENVQPNEGEILRIFALKTNVTPEDFEDVDPEADNTEKLIEQYLLERADGFDNLGTGDWNNRVIRRD